MSGNPILGVVGDPEKDLIMENKEAEAPLFDRAQVLLHILIEHKRRSLRYIRFGSDCPWTEAETQTQRERLSQRERMRERERELEPEAQPKRIERQEEMSEKEREGKKKTKDRKQ